MMNAIDQSLSRKKKREDKSARKERKKKRKKKRKDVCRVGGFAQALLSFRAHQKQAKPVFPAARGPIPLGKFCAAVRFVLPATAREQPLRLR